MTCLVCLSLRVSEVLCSSSDQPFAYMRQSIDAEDETSSDTPGNHMFQHSETNVPENTHPADCSALLS